MNIYLPVADMMVNSIYLVAIGFIAGICSGLYGISGGILTVPALIFFGIPSHIAVGAASSQTVGTAFVGNIRNFKKNNIETGIAAIVFIASLAGSIFGVRIFSILRKAGYIDMVIACIYISVFGLIAIMIYTDVFLSKFLKRIDFFNSNESGLRSKKGGILTFYSSFLDQEISLVSLFLIGLLVGFLSALLGIGGATILVPAFIYVLRIPFSIASGTALFQTFLTSIVVTFLHANQNHSVDVILSLTMLISSVFGVRIGVRISSKCNQSILKLTLGILITVICIKFVLITFVQEPSSLFIVE